MKKRFVSVLLIVLIILTLTLTSACGNEAADTESKLESSEEKKETKKETKKENEKGKRSNPIDLGEMVEWKVKFYSDDWDGLKGKANVRLNKVYEGEEAIEMLYFGADALENVEEGYTYAVADMTVELTEGDQDSPYKTSFSIGSVSEDGRKSPFGYTSLAKQYEENEYTDLYPGGSVNIKKALLVPKDQEYLIEIEENISGTKFFKHQ